MKHTFTTKHFQNENSHTANIKQFPNPKTNGIWTKKEQFIIFEEFKKNFLKWKCISQSLQNRTENSVKSFFYATIRKIKRFKFLKLYKMMICFPTFRNNSKFSLFSLYRFLKFVTHRATIFIFVERRREKKDHDC